MRPWMRVLHDAQRAHCRPFTSTGHGSQKSPSLRDELRRLYKLIHPDLFHNFPDQKATNGRSFQLLQEYLNRAQGNDDSERRLYHFEFYIHHNVDTEPFKKVEVELPLPNIGYHQGGSEGRLHGTISAVCRLLSACGLSSEFSTNIYEDKIPAPHDTAGMHPSGFAPHSYMRLSEFFQQASELQRQGESSLLNLEQQTIVVKNALRLGRRISVLFKTALSDVQKLDALQQLAKAVDAATKTKLIGCTIVIGSCYGMDTLGNLWLDYGSHAEQWIDYLNEVNVHAVESRRSAAKLRQLKEFQLAHLMEVEMIFANDSLGVRDEYMSFLDHLLRDAEKEGAVGGGKFYELPIRIIDVASNNESCIVEDVYPEKEPFSIDESMGYVAVPIWGDIASIYEFIEEAGEEALKYRRKFKMEEVKIDDLKSHVRKKLRLRNLTFDKKLRPDQLQSACMRLLRHASQLQKYTEDLALCISYELRLPQGTKGVAHLNWNFSMSDL